MVGGSARAAGVTRRWALGAGAVAAGTLLGGCERSSPAPAHYGEGETDQSVDALVLLRLIELEQGMVGTYRAVAAALTGADGALARHLLGQETFHLDGLVALYRGLVRGRLGVPVAPAPVRIDPARALAAAHRAEERAIAAYLDAMAKFAEPRFRGAVAAILADEAEHLAVLDRAAGRPVAPAALVTGRA